jgi:hypothetical protein
MGGVLEGCRFLRLLLVSIDSVFLVSVGAYIFSSGVHLASDTNVNNV